jgi:hypothetical protein
MDRTPTALVIDYLSGDLALCAEARRRLTLDGEPTDMLSRIENAIRRRPSHDRAILQNERAIRMRAQFGPLRLALVQRASQQAPAAIGGFQPLLRWALARVDWQAVVASIDQAIQRHAPGDCEPARASSPCALGTRPAVA